MQSPVNSKPRHPKVFISYTHDDLDHQIWVEHFAKDLMSNGIDVVLDQWDLSGGADLYHFMEKGIADSEFVLAICTIPYKSKADNRSGGCGYESRISSSLLADDQLGKKFIPILRKGGKQAIPTYLKPAVFRDFSDDSLYEEKIRLLIEELYQIEKRPPTGWRKGNNNVIHALFGVVAPPSGHESARSVRKFGIHRPPIISSMAIDDIRNKNNVSKIRPLDNDLPVDRINYPAFGFCTPWALNTDPRGIVGGTGLSTLSLLCKPDGTRILEIHKLGTGEICIIGYVSTNDSSLISDPARKGYADIMLFVEPWNEFTSIVSIPYSRLVNISQRSISDGQYFLDLTVD